MPPAPSYAGDIREADPFEFATDAHVTEMRECKDELLEDLDYLGENVKAICEYAVWAFDRIEKLVAALKFYNGDSLRQIKETTAANPDAECLKDLSRAIDGAINAHALGERESRSSRQSGRCLTHRGRCSMHGSTSCSASWRTSQTDVTALCDSLDHRKVASPVSCREKRQIE